MNPPVEGWELTTSKEPVFIPNADGSAVAETLWVEVPAWRDPVSGTMLLGAEAQEKLEAVKARYLGILSPAQLRDLRAAVGVSQKKMAGLLQLGEKSWTRWETGRERPSRSINVLLCALYDGKVDVGYLETLADPRLRSQFARWKPSVRWEATPYGGTVPPVWNVHESSSCAA